MLPVTETAGLLRSYGIELPPMSVVRTPQELAGVTASAAYPACVKIADPAVAHNDHKFDRFSTKDFYSMEAFFADVKEWGFYGSVANTELEGFDNQSPFPPEIKMESPFLERHLASLNRQIEQQVAAAQPSSIKPRRKGAIQPLGGNGAAISLPRTDGWLAPVNNIHNCNKERQRR